MDATVLQRLENQMERFTAAQRKAADYILKHPTEVAFLTTEKLADLVGVSVASIMRMTYALGYTGYTQFQKDLQEMLRSRVAPPSRLEANVKRLGRNKLLVRCAEVQMNNIKKTVEFLSDEAIDNAFALMTAAKKIYVVGVRGSSPVADFLHSSLNRLGIDCELLIPDSGRLHSLLVRLTPDDLVIAFSLPRYAKRTLEIVRAAKSKGAKILSVTDGYASPLALLSDVFLACAFESLSFHHSEIGALFVADFLLTGVANQNSAKTKNYLEEVENITEIMDANIIK
ncbi:MAG: MurR/RpiR family transcriptional regulator [Negativicutes bacterium]|nr:MurR/RpiR family transcriptional regulator [Negativicutes bacterium]